MEQLLLINPKARSKKMAKSRRRRSPAQVAATRRLVALNRSRKGGAKRRRRNPIAAAPASRRRRASSLVKRHVVRRRRNPIGISAGGIMGMFMPALKGAAGALAIDAVMKYTPLPANMKTGVVGNLMQAAAAVILGTMGRRFLGSTATTMAVGALTVTAYRAGQNALAQAGFPLGYYGGGVTAIMPSVNAGAAPSSMGAYLPNASARGNAGFNFSPSNQFGEYVY